VKTAIVVFIVLVVVVVITVLIGSFVYRWRRAQRSKIPIKDQEEELELQESSLKDHSPELLPPE
jgi:Na+-transporting methylmalonyl-CoA/oxaloacetate decarboxylase gamma subunit